MEVPSKNNPTLLPTELMGENNLLRKILSFDCYAGIFAPALAQLVCWGWGISTPAILFFNIGLVLFFSGLRYLVYLGKTDFVAWVLILLPIFITMSIVHVLHSPFGSLILLPVSINGIIFFPGKKGVSWLLTSGIAILGIVSWSIELYHLQRIPLEKELQVQVMINLSVFVCLTFYKVFSLVVMYQFQYQKQRISEVRLREFLTYSPEPIFNIGFHKPLSIQLPIEEQLEHVKSHSYMRECNEAFTILYGAGMPENIRNWPIGKINVELWDEMGDPYFKLFAEMGYKIEDVLIPVKIRGKQPMVLSNSVFSIINNGKIVAIWGVQRDVTKITEARKALEEKNLALQQYIQSNMQLENFAYIASHDLKAPIRTIISFSQLLQRELGERIREKEQNFLNRIIDGARGMSKLIHGLLEYSRVGGGTLSKEEIEVPKLLHEILKDLKSTIKESNAKVEIIGMPTRIEGNSTQIRQLFQNLIENGIKFKRENIPPLIRISAQQKGSCWEFAISDNGIGIKKAHHQKIFKLFQKLHDGQQYEGTGIGLALAKRIVEQHGGTISLESSPEKGSTFHFSLCQ